MNEGTIARWRTSPWSGPAALFVGVLLSGGVACERLPPLLDCGALPDASACPTAKGGTCDDPSCSALYECTASGWAFVQRCETASSGGASGAGGAAGGDNTGRAGNGGAAGEPLCQPVARDPACPALQAPDCDEASARACPTQACLGQCDVFLTCTSSGWSEKIAGYCDEGELILVADRESGRLRTANCLPGTAMRAVDVAVGTAIFLPPVPVPAGGGVLGGSAAVFAGTGEVPGGRASVVPLGVAAGGGAAVVGVGVVGATVWATGGAMPVTAGPAVVAGVAGVAGVAAGWVVLVLLGPETREPPLTGSTGPPVVTTQPTANIEPTAAAANHLNWVSFISLVS